MVELRPVFIGIVASNFDATVAFYRDALGVPLHPGAYEEPHAEYSWRKPYFHLAIFSAGDTRQPTSAAQIGFAVENLADMHAKLLTSGGNVVEAPRARPWGHTATYRDPDGNLVTLTELTPERRSLSQSG